MAGEAAEAVESLGCALPCGSMATLAEPLVKAILFGDIDEAEEPFWLADWPQDGPENDEERVRRQVAAAVWAIFQGRDEAKLI